MNKCKLFISTCIILILSFGLSIYCDDKMAFEKGWVYEDFINDAKQSFPGLLSPEEALAAKNGGGAAPTAPTQTPNVVVPPTQTAKCVHEYVPTVVKEADCTNEGEMKYVCKNCEDTYTEAIPVDPNAHSFNLSVETPAGCENEGRAVQSCIICGATGDVVVTDALGHDYKVKETTEPTCNEEGSKVYECSRCYSMYSEPIPALGHDEVESYSATLTIGSYNFDGKYTYTCNRCGAVRTEADPNSYPMMWLYIACGVLIGLIAVIIILIAVKVKKKK